MSGLVPIGGIMDGRARRVIGNRALDGKGDVQELGGLRLIRQIGKGKGHARLVFAYNRIDPFSIRGEARAWRKDIVARIVVNRLPIRRGIGLTGEGRNRNRSEVSLGGNPGLGCCEGKQGPCRQEPGLRRGRYHGRE